MTFDHLLQKGTSAPNYDLSTKDIIETLKRWDERYGIEISEVGHDRLTLGFKTLPDDVALLTAELYAFCPDVIDQGFGCFDDITEMMQASGQPLPPDLSELIRGIDFDDETFGEQLLSKTLMTSKTVALWWD